MTTGTIELIEARATEMRNKTFLCETDGEVHKIVNHRILDAKLLLNTNKRLFRADIEHGMTLLNAFVVPPGKLPAYAEQEKMEQVQSVTLPTQHMPATKVVREVQSLNSAHELKEILMDNVRRIREDKEYIPQAIAISDSVSTLIELAKVEIRAIEMMDRSR